MQPSVKCKLLESAFSSQTDNRQSGNTDDEEEERKKIVRRQKSTMCYPDNYPLGTISSSNS